MEPAAPAVRFDRRWGKFAALVSLLLNAALLSAGVSGCRPSETSAKTRTKPMALSGPGAAARARQAKKDVAAVRSEASPEYVLPFEPRDNPFARPRAEPDQQTGATATVRAADVRLMGLLLGSSSGKDASSMAVVEIGGERKIVFTGTILGVAPGVERLRIVAIRKFDIVVEQRGKRWIVPLSEP